eukprot:CAMPEP_0206585478 /NCGR_PEP_ID=MMETSP0325_2-20121206/36445_1 /ASSEMBLY_ACC=CAM_ASM_000347 /TAXON_ID=2866 /ORGANISM="Crypthecodinium cohnii, Strain Seligo" /LENGTH=728 /DNA_ID=CAMNT_0054093041 /DNA_START=189 /DNA_END=2375 /DNA_ORIENTATION=+
MSRRDTSSDRSTDAGGPSSDASTPPVPVPPPSQYQKSTRSHQGGSDRGEQTRSDKQHKWINRQITDAADSGQIKWLLQVIQQNLSSMNLINFSTALHRTARLALTCSVQAREQVLNGATMRQMRITLARYFEQTIDADGSWRQNRRTEDQASEMRCLSIICWSCATLRMREEIIFTRTAAAAKLRLHEMKSFELSNLLWSFAKLSLGDVSFFEALAPHLLRRRPGQFSPQCLSTIIWSFGTLKVHHQALFTSVARELTLNSHLMTPQGIANTAWAYARVRRQESALFRALGDAAVHEDVLWTFKPQEISNTVWAFATVGLAHPTLFEEMSHVAVSRRWQLPPQNVANIVWAYAKLNAPARATLFPALLEVTTSELDHYKPQEIAAILWAIARENGTCGRDLFLDVSRHFQVRLPEFTSQGLACMAEAFIASELDSLPFFESVIDEGVSRIRSFQAPSLCTLLRTLVLKAQRHPSSRANVSRFDTVCDHILLRLPEMAPHNLVHLAQSLDMLPEVLQRASQASLRALVKEGMSPQQQAAIQESAEQGLLISTLDALVLDPQFQSPVMENATADCDDNPFSAPAGNSHNRGRDNFTKGKSGGRSHQNTQRRNPPHSSSPYAADVPSRSANSNPTPFCDEQDLLLAAGIKDHGRTSPHSAPSKPDFGWPHPTDVCRPEVEAPEPSSLPWWASSTPGVLGQALLGGLVPPPPGLAPFDPQLPKYVSALGTSY